MFLRVVISEDLKSILSKLGNVDGVEIPDGFVIREIRIFDDRIELVSSKDVPEEFIRWLKDYTNLPVISKEERTGGKSDIPLDPVDRAVTMWDEIVREINGSIPYFNGSITPMNSSGKLKLKVPNSFMAERLMKKRELLEKGIEKVIGEKVTVSIEVCEDEMVEKNSNEKKMVNVPPRDSESKDEDQVGPENWKGNLLRVFRPGEQVKVYGRIFHIEDYGIHITDDSDSIFCRFNGMTRKKVENLDLKLGDHVEVSGTVYRDDRRDEIQIKISEIGKLNLPERMDNANVKRVELHLHSKMSALDGLVDLEDLFNRLKSWGHEAVAITDHGVVQAFPEFQKLALKNGIKPIFGMEAYMVDDVARITHNVERNDDLVSATFVVVDLETTGLDPMRDEIVEIGAVKIKNSEIVEEYHTLIKPTKSMSRMSERLTGINDEMLKDAPTFEEVFPGFLEFIKDATLVAHNANFDYRFLRSAVKRVLNEEWEFQYIDTLGLSKALLDMKSYSLDRIAKKLKIGDFRHHRALDDARITAKIFLRFIEMLKLRGINRINQLERVRENIDVKKLSPYHVTILVKNKEGLKNLYEMVSKSHLEYFHSKPKIPKSLLMEKRNGLLLGTACLSGELAENYLEGATLEELEQLAAFYDFIEVMPLDVVAGGEVNGEKFKEMFRTFYEIGRKLNIPVVMTGDVHFLDPEDGKIRAVLMAAQDRKNYSDQPSAFLRTTEEMLESAIEIFDDERIAKEIVVENTRKIADMIEEFNILDGKLHPPIIENSEKIIEEETMKKAHEYYGDPLPEVVENRLKKELNAIIEHGYSVLYLIAQKLVRKSNEDGYVVGSRGSVGSSLVAYLLGITEVNPLPPHYRCPKCLHTEFITDGSYGSGFDLPRKKCPICGTDLMRDGQDIPFEVFMGFKGDKIPDIDLNFSGEYQSRAHKYIEKLFGKEHVFRAGTISTVAERSAFGYVKKYEEKEGRKLRSSEVLRLAMRITGVKRTTGQHPGGLMIVPKDMDIHDFTPVQYPANDSKSGVRTTHFDYESIHDDLVKIDILGHDDPTFIKMLKDITGVDPMKIDMNDRATLSIFSSVKALKLKSKFADVKVGTLGIPEFGTQFVRQMLEETKPSSFADLVRISGLSHGTDVWLNNARDLIVSGKATLKDVIACRDDIMNYLIKKGMDELTAFKIMENVRKGKGLTEDFEEEMKKCKVPKWFIESCKRIKYLFPKAHAVAYVMMAFRIAYFKVHHPLAFYATYFTVKGDEFNTIVILKGPKAIKERLNELSGIIHKNVKEKAEETNLLLALEMMMRGFKFLPVNIFLSDPRVFKIEGDGLRIPLNKIPGLGDKLAKSIDRARSKRPFTSVEDMIRRTGITKANVETMRELHMLDDLPEKEQISLF